MDAHTTIAELQLVVRKFVSERSWEPFHTPKNLTMALAIEAAELMEHFQWSTADEATAVIHDPEKKAAVAEEMADVFCYLLALTDVMQVDLAQAMRAKMIKNAAKYPVEKYRGRYGDDDRRPVLSS